VTLQRGGCHCGRVRFEVRGEIRRAETCNCSICAMKAYVHWIVPREDFRLLTPEHELAEYRFNTGVARHRFCRHCGVASFYVPRSDPDRVDVNLRCVEGVDVERIEIGRFDGRHWEEAFRAERGHEPPPPPTPPAAARAEPTVRRAHHVSFAVADLARSQRFFGELLGLPEIPRPDFGFPGAWYQAGEIEVHLIVAPAGAPVGTPPPRISPVADHAAFQVADYAGARERLRAAGHDVIELGAEVGQLFVQDPDGHVIELIVPGGRLGRRP
jgi:catechol 2,3-dioxygenase-like lactoylglutathione lyase family enzyme